MDKSEGKDWLAKTLNNVTEETAKVYKISRLKLEINTFNKTYDEKMHKISKRLLKLIEQGTIDATLFEPEYSLIIKISKKIEEMVSEIEAIKGNLKFGFGKKKHSDDNEKNIVSDTTKDDKGIEVTVETIKNDKKKKKNNK